VYGKKPPSGNKKSRKFTVDEIKEIRRLNWEVRMTLQGIIDYLHLTVSVPTVYSICAGSTYRDSLTDEEETMLIEKYCK